MSASDLRALAPLLVLAAGAIVVMLQAAFWRRHGLAAGLAAATLLASLAALPCAASVAPRQVTPLLTIDGFALYYTGLLCVAALVATLLAYGYARERGGWREEFYVLLLSATLGAAALAASAHLLAFFVSLELLSLSLFALIAYPVTRRRPLEAALKYLVLSGMSSALLAFGIALIYFVSGTLAYLDLAAAVTLHAAFDRPILLAGFALVLAGIGFKLSLVPFHLWAPDVYEGAPAPVAALLATVSKGAVAVLLLRLLDQAQLYAHPAVLTALEAMALASILVGNLLALLQGNIKRLLAYSSIAHFGYLMIAFIAGGAFGREAAAYYLAAYFVMTLGAFGVVARLSARDTECDFDLLEDYRGLFWRRPWLAAALGGMLLALAGMPLTMGFVAKFYLFVAAVGEARWGLVATLVAGSVIGLFYYLRVVAILFARPEESLPARALPGGLAAGASGIALCALVLALLWLGVYPQSAIELLAGARQGPTHSAFLSFNPPQPRPGAARTSATRTRTLPAAAPYSVRERTNASD